MRRREAGFTLLEMLVALVVFGLVMDGIAQTFKFGLAAWRQGPSRTAEPENLAAMDAALTRIVGAALPGSMTGEPGQFSFTAPLPPGAGLAGALADAALLQQGDTLVLRYRQHPAGIPLQPLPPGREETLATGVLRLQMSYLKQKSGGPPAWIGRWKGNRLPLLIRLHLDLADGRDWPDLIIAPVSGGG